MIDIIAELAIALNRYGPVTALLAGLASINGFFIWRDYRREYRLQERLEELQRVHNEIVFPLLKECTEAVASCKEVIKQNSTIITGLLQNGR